MSDAVYYIEFTDQFKKIYRKLKSKPELKKRLQRKILEIQQDPHHYKNLRNDLKGRQRVRIDSHVLIFEVIENHKTILL
jgi:mRNA-degrading endonuclease RelE of RelBE toxin-antitoxin system